MKPTSQQDKKYEEERARRVLALLFPARYGDTVLSESPDILARDNRVGVEITDARTSEFRTLCARIRGLAGKTGAELDAIDGSDARDAQIFLARTRQGAYSAGFTLTGDAYQFGAAYAKKLKKLNDGHFQRCAQNDLLITAWMITDAELEAGAAEILRQAATAENAACALQFDRIYILCEACLVEICPAAGTIRSHPIERQRLRAVSDAAFLAVFGRTRAEISQ